MKALLRCATLAGAGICMLPSAYAAKTSESAAQAVYQKERAACIEGRSGQSRVDCLKEAAAALAEARRGRLDNGESARSLEGNGKDRCRWVKAEDRDDCLRMAQGEGKVSGSVQGGGVIKELVTRTPQTPVPPVAASPTQ